LTRTELHIAPVTFRSQVCITNPDVIQEPDIAMGSPILRMPEFVRNGKKRRPPGYTEWEILRPERELRYRWAAPDTLKQEYATDFWGHLVVDADELRFDVTYRNIGDVPASDGVSLFCLQGGTSREFHDVEGRHTYVWSQDRFMTINELIDGNFPEHRMTGGVYDPTGEKPASVARKLMAKRCPQTGFILAIALDKCSGVSGNFNVWPSCIHVNPNWGLVQPGQEVTARGTVYFFAGELDDLAERYIRDYEVAR
jgi:hypothetical protein